MASASADSAHTAQQQLRVGVLALQGAFEEHAALLRTLGTHVTEVKVNRLLHHLEGVGRTRAYCVSP